MDISAQQSSRVIPTVPPRGINGPRVLSIGQQRLWYLAQLAPDSGVYNVPFSSRIHGRVEIVALEKAFNRVIERHEVLRTVILAPGGKPVPILLKKWSLNLKTVDLRHIPGHLREAEASRILREESFRPFNFARDLMLRCALVQLADEEYLLHHVAPHLVFEGSSLWVLFRDLSRFYTAGVTDKPAELPEMRMQYCDFALWQLDRLQGERLTLLTNYWRDQLIDAPQIDLPIDLPRPAIHTLRGTRLSFAIPPDLLAACHQFFRENGTTPYRGLFAAFNVLLCAYTRQTDISVGSPFMPRCTGIEDLIGFFVNTVVLRSNLAGNPTFRTLMHRTDVVVRGAIQHADLTFDKLVEVLHPSRDSARNPLFQVNFRAPKEPYPTLELIGLTAERAQYLDNGTSKFDLALEVESHRGEACFFEYCVDMWKRETVEQMIIDFKTLLRGLITQPDAPLDCVPAFIEMNGRIGKQSIGTNR
jgi:Condensation domain